MRPRVGSTFVNNYLTKPDRPSNVRFGAGQHGVGEPSVVRSENGYG